MQGTRKYPVRPPSAGCLMDADSSRHSIFESQGRAIVRKLATPLVMLALALVLMGAGVAASGPADGAGSHVFTDSGLTLQLTSSMPGVTFSGNTLVCPPMLITTSSGENLAACEFTISSIGAVAPSTVVVTMTMAGITPAEVAADKFAIAPQPGPLVYPGTSPKTIYSFTGAGLPVTVSPGVVWGATAGTALDNSDLSATIVVTYTVVAESLEGPTASPTPTPTPTPTVTPTVTPTSTPTSTPTVTPTSTPFQSFAGETATPIATQTPFESFEGETATPYESFQGVTSAPGQTATPPATGAANNSSSGGSTPLFALLICLAFAGIGLLAVQAQRRRMRG